ncbi:MAG TPA: ASCH domain-containing protein [Patescibacteria group bacterium]|nr:ASCH domain-containing protein [Patescibacteria group bacterium]
MKAISLKQPWANHIASGEKTIETRKWSTKYRGDLLIVSSKSPNIPPAGQALAVVELVDCRPMVKADERAAMCEVYPKAQSWVLKNIRRIKPFPVKGQLNLYEVDFEYN